MENCNANLLCKLAVPNCIVLVINSQYSKYILKSINSIKKMQAVSEAATLQPSIAFNFSGINQSLGASKTR